MSGHVSGDTLRSMRRTLLGGLCVGGILSTGLAGWAAQAQFAGAIISPGVLVVSSNVKKVQHPSGGIVGELLVRDGAQVSAGDVLLRLDPTIMRANLMIVSRSIDELTARQARLVAEQDGAETVTFPQSLLEGRGPEAIEAVRGERRLFELRQAARKGLASQYRERIAQMQEQIRGLTDQTSAKKREADLIIKELTGVRALWAQKLIQIPRLTGLEREAARLEGERGALISSIAQSRSRIAETELQIIQIGEDLRKEVGRELADVRGKLAELVEKKVAAEDQLNRTEIRAPQSGFVHQLSVHTIGGVISPGEPIMLVVPRADELIAESRIAPQDIDHVIVGQQARLRFPAFNQRTTPELTGEVLLVAADVSQDQKSGANFYTVRIKIGSGEVERLGGLRLVPGMPVEAFIATGERTVLSYLLKPLSDQISKAWRES